MSTSEGSRIGYIFQGECARQANVFAPLRIDYKRSLSFLAVYDGCGPKFSVDREIHSDGPRSIACAILNPSRYLSPNVAFGLLLCIKCLKDEKLDGFLDGTEAVKVLVLVSNEPNCDSWPHEERG